MRETTRSEFSNRSQNLSKKSLEQTSITSARKQKAVKSIRKTQLQKQLWPRHPWFPTLSDWEKTSLEWIHLLKWDTKFHWNSQNFAQNAKCDIIGLFLLSPQKAMERQVLHVVESIMWGKMGLAGKILLVVTGRHLSQHLKQPSLSSSRRKNASLTFHATSYDKVSLLSPLPH